MMSAGLSWPLVTYAGVVIQRDGVGDAGVLAAQDERKFIRRQLLDRHTYLSTRNFGMLPKRMPVRCGREEIRRSQDRRIEHSLGDKGEAGVGCVESVTEAAGSSNE